ncbi:MAG: hypothetical protein MJZ11_12605 [Lachnospiraceae bacterium]|nr:hypothetical protein [Lachnospiraceae bacterium]
MSNERKIDQILNKEYSIKNLKFKTVDILFVAALWIFALIIRIKLYPIISADYWGFLEEWMNKIKELGGFRSMGTKISNYSSSYMYLMCIVSGAENSMYALKTISVVFDYLASIAVFLIIHNITKSTRKSIIGMAILLLCPTVFIDSAYWCQCDIIYTCIILYALYFFFKGNSKICFIILGVAFSFKLQTVFILPFMLIMWLKNKTVKLIDFLYILVVFALIQIPAWMMGRPFSELLGVYFDQSSYYPWGTLEYPNIYALLDETMQNMHHTPEITGAGTFVTILILGFLAYYIYTKKIKLTSDLMITIALFTVAITVYCLPHMHDRYGFLIDLLAIIYAVLRPKKLPIMIGFFMVSLMTFMPYLIAVHILPITIVAIVQLILIASVGYDMYKQIDNNFKLS